MKNACLKRPFIASVHFERQTDYRDVRNFGHSSLAHTGPIRNPNKIALGHASSPYFCQGAMMAGAMPSSWNNHSLPDTLNQKLSGSYPTPY